MKQLLPSSTSGLGWSQEVGALFGVVLLCECESTRKLFTILFTSISQTSFNRVKYHLTNSHIFAECYSLSCTYM